MVHDKTTKEERSWRSFNSTNLSPRAEINRKRRNFGGAFRSLFKNVPTTTTTSAAFVQSKSKRAGGKRRVEGGGQILEPIFGVVKFPFPGLFAQTSPPLLCSFPLQQKLSRHKKHITIRGKGGGEPGGISKWERRGGGGGREYHLTAHTQSLAHFFENSVVISIPTLMLISNAPLNFPEIVFLLLRTLDVRMAGTVLEHGRRKKGTDCRRNI